jgi:hypothetical protein
MREGMRVHDRLGPAIPRKTARCFDLRDGEVVHPSRLVEQAVELELVAAHHEANLPHARNHLDVLEVTRYFE